jgi:hypothetical protein
MRPQFMEDFWRRHIFFQPPGKKVKKPVKNYENSCAYMKFTCGHRIKGHALDMRLQFFPNLCTANAVKKGSQAHKS